MMLLYFSFNFHKSYMDSVALSHELSSSAHPLSCVLHVCSDFSTFKRFHFIENFTEFTTVPVDLFLVETTCTAAALC